MDDFDKMFEEWLGSMRNLTEEEQNSINDYINSISQDIGVNIFDLMDEYEKEHEF